MTRSRTVEDEDEDDLGDYDEDEEEEVEEIVRTYVRALDIYYMLYRK